MFALLELFQELDILRVKRKPEAIVLSTGTNEGMAHSMKVRARGWDRAPRPSFLRPRLGHCLTSYTAPPPPPPFLPEQKQRDNMVMLNSIAYVRRVMSAWGEGQRDLGRAPHPAHTHSPHAACHTRTHAPACSGQELPAGRL